MVCSHRQSQHQHPNRAVLPPIQNIQKVSLNSSFKETQESVSNRDCQSEHTGTPSDTHDSKESSTSSELKRRGMVGSQPASRRYLRQARLFFNSSSSASKSLKSGSNAVALVVWIGVSWHLSGKDRIQPIRPSHVHERLLKMTSYRVYASNMVYICTRLDEVSTHLRLMVRVLEGTMT